LPAEIRLAFVGDELVVADVDESGGATAFRRLLRDAMRIVDAHRRRLALPRDVLDLDRAPADTAIEGQRNKPAEIDLRLVRMTECDRATQDIDREGVVRCGRAIPAPARGSGDREDRREGASKTTSAHPLARACTPRRCTQHSLRLQPAALVAAVARLECASRARAVEPPSPRSAA